MQLAGGGKAAAAESASRRPFSQSGQLTTYLTVWHQRGQQLWEQSQYSRVFGSSPDSQTCALECAIVTALNNDSRYEIAVLDFITPWVGEQLMIPRQSCYHGLGFSPLRAIARDEVVTILLRPRGPHRCCREDQGKSQP